MVNPYVARVQLRFGDLDAQGHVGHVVFAEYLQEARTQFMMVTPAQALLESGCVVVRQQIQYLAPIQFSADPLEIDLAVAELGAARFVFAYRVWQDGKLCARARTTMCPYDFEVSAPRRLTRLERESLASRLVEVEPLRELTTPELAGRGTPLEVATRWSDADRYGHINNVRYLDFVMAGRIHTTSMAHPSMTRAGTGDASLLWLVARLDVDYLVQMDFRLQPYRVLTAPVRLGTSSMVLASEVVDPHRDTVLAKARCVLVSADADGSKQPLPDPARDALEGLLVSD